MKKLLTSIALISALGAGSAMVHAQSEGYGEGYWNEFETGLWESDNFANDEYGVYDQDFNWEADDQAWNDFYDDSYSTAWNDYDDIGDGGWFDV